MKENRHNFFSCDNREEFKSTTVFTQSLGRGAGSHQRQFLSNKPIAYRIPENYSLPRQGSATGSLLNDNNKFESKTTLAPFQQLTSSNLTRLYRETAPPLTSPSPYQPQGLSLAERSAGSWVLQAAEHRYRGTFPLATRLTVGAIEGLHIATDFKHYQQDNLQQGNGERASRFCAAIGSGATFATGVGGHALVGVTVSGLTANPLVGAGATVVSTPFVEKAAEVVGDLSNKGCLYICQKNYRADFWPSNKKLTSTLSIPPATSSSPMTLEPQIRSMPPMRTR